MARRYVNLDKHPPMNAAQIRQAAVERVIARRRPPVFRTEHRRGPSGEDLTLQVQVSDGLGEFSAASSCSDAIDDLIIQTPLFNRSADLLLQIAEAARSQGQAAAVAIARKAGELHQSDQDWLCDMAGKWLAATAQPARPVLAAVVRELDGL